MQNWRRGGGKLRRLILKRPLVILTVLLLPSLSLAMTRGLNVWSVKKPTKFLRENQKNCKEALPVDRQGRGEKVRRRNLNYELLLYCVCSCVTCFAVHVGSGRKKGKGPKQDSPLLATKTTSNTTSKKQKTSHDPRSSSSVGSSLPVVAGQAPGSPGNWIPSDCNFGVMFYGF